MKSTERHTADTQITDWADYKISAVASILQYTAASAIFASCRPYDVIVYNGIRPIGRYGLYNRRG
jgi:hypothetical protein